MLPALEGTLSGLGIELRSQENVHLDIESRPTKSPRAFCAPIEVPGRVMLVIQPIGGPDDWHALFHEAGHYRALRAHLRGPPVEARRLGRQRCHRGLGDAARAPRQRAHVARARLDFARPEDFAAEASAGQLYFVRRYAAKFLYELELHGEAALESMRGRYVERMQDALKIEVSDVDFLADVDAGFYSSSYLRAWASSPSCARSCARSSAAPGSRAARRARSCGSSGRRPEADRDELLARSPAAELTSLRWPSESGRLSP
jgi:hypothetical protein